MAAVFKGGMLNNQGAGVNTNLIGSTDNWGGAPIDSGDTIIIFGCYGGAAAAAADWLDNMIGSYGSNPNCGVIALVSHPGGQFHLGAAYAAIQSPTAERIVGMELNTLRPSRSVAVHRYSGLRIASNPFIASANGNSSNNAAIAAGAVNPGGSGLVLAAFASDEYQLTYTSAGNTKRFEADQLTTFEKITTGAGDVTMSATGSGATGAKLALSLAFRDTVTGGGAQIIFTGGGQMLGI